MQVLGESMESICFNLVNICLGLKALNPRAFGDSASALCVDAVKKSEVYISVNNQTLH